MEKIQRDLISQFGQDMASATNMRQFFTSENADS